MIDRCKPLAVIVTALALALVCHRTQAQAATPTAPEAVAASIPSLTAPKPAAEQLRAARLTFVAGAVRVQRSDNTGEDTAVLNMPLAEGTRVLTGDYGQAEIEFEDGSVARLTPRSGLSISLLALDAAAHIAHTQLDLLGGLAYFELRKSPASTWRIDAAGTRVTPLENLTLRLNLDEPPALFAVLTGAAHIERPDAFEADVHANESLQAGKDGSRYTLTPQLAPESWDTWNESRDQSAADAADKRTAARNDYAGDQGYGWSDLDANGNWYTVPGTGPNSPPVWQPDNADEGFDPYGYGAWVWGNGAYLWASSYAWGWTPFRCGHWQYFNGFGWGWMPDASCGRWGFGGGGSLAEGGGGGVLIRGNYPPRHNPVVRPLPRPGAPHPILPVYGPDGPRPWTPHTGPVKIAGAPAIPLPVLGSNTPRSGSMVGRALALDYPIDRKTHQPVLGTPPSTATYVNNAPSTPRLSPGIRTPRVDTQTSAAPPRYHPDPGIGLPLVTKPAPPSSIAQRPSLPAPTHVPSPAQAPLRAPSPPPQRSMPPAAPAAPAPRPKA